MTEGPRHDGDHLQRVLALTPVGRHELREPQSGLSLPQRWLLGQMDGQCTLAELAARPGSPAAGRLPRDAAKLASLGLALDVGEPGPTPSAFGPSTLYGEITLTLPLGDEASAELAPGAGMAGVVDVPRRSTPALAIALALGVVAAGAFYFGRGPVDAVAHPTPAAEAAKGAAAGAIAQDPTAAPRTVAAPTLVPTSEPASAAGGVTPRR